MAYEESRFFDSVNSDKQYTAEQFAEYFRQFLTSGVFDFGNNLKVSATTGLNVSVGFGAAMIDGYGYWLKDDEQGVKTLALEAADSLPRIDRVIVILNRALETRDAHIYVKKGTPAASPVAPTLGRGEVHYEISLASVYIAANATTIIPQNITDERTNINLCGRVEPKAVRENINQGVKTTDSPTFVGGTFTGTVNANKVIGAVYQ